MNNELFDLFRHVGIKGGCHNHDLLIMGVPLGKLDKFEEYFWFERECRPDIDQRNLTIEAAKRLGYYRCNPWDSRAEDYYKNLNNLDHLNYLFDSKIDDYKGKLKDF